MEENGEDTVFINTMQVTQEAGKPTQKQTGKLIKTIALCAAFLGLGLAIAVTGPTLPYLQAQVGVSTDKIGIIFTCRSVGYLLGSLGSGWLLDHWNSHQDVMFGLGLLLNSLGLAFSPWTTELAVLALLTSVTGLAMGLLDAGGNSVCLNLWGPRSPPYLQALHFSFGVGAVLAPLIAAPFLEGTTFLPSLNVSVLNGTAMTTAADVSTKADFISLPPTSTVDLTFLLINQTNGSGNGTTISTSRQSHRKMFDAYIDNVQIVFLLMASFLFAISVAFAAFEIRRYITGATQKLVPKDVARDQQKRTDRPFLISMLILMFLFYVFYCGLEVAYGQYLATFAIEHGGFHENDASLLTAVYWGVFTFGRGCAIFVAHHCSPTKMVFGSFVCSLTALLFLCFSLSMHPVMLWIFSGLLGFGLAAIFPSGFTWAEQHLHVSGKVAAVFVVGASVGEMALPATVGYLLAKAGSMYMMYALTGFCVVDILIFTVLCVLAYRPCKREQDYLEKEAEEIDMERLETNKSNAASAAAATD